MSYPSESPPYVQSGIATVAERIEASWRGLLTPTVLITVQLLVLAWLLLFLVVGEAAEARAPEVALAKLRGFSRLQTLRFGLSEVMVLLAAAVPAGVVCGWAGAMLLAGYALRAGTPVPLTWTGWAAAGAATLGGVLAAVLAARRALVRPVLQQWRRTARAPRRGWVVDALVGTAAAAGLVELVLGGTIAAPGQHVLALLCPGLLAVAVATTASRLLPAGCRAAYGWTLRHGGVATFLAVRQIARRPGGTRTTVVLVAAFALTTFALAANAVVHANVLRVAGTEVGAATVLTVVPPPGQRTSDIVARLDPGGTQAVAVRQHVDLSTPPVRFLAVDPARFAAVAAWPDGTPADFAALLNPPTASPVVMTGDRIRVRLDVEASSPGDGTRLSFVVQSSRAYRATPVDLGAVRKGSRTLEAALPSCPCTLRQISAVGAAGRYARLVVRGIEVHRPGGWTPLDADLTTGDGWRWQQSYGAEEQASPTARGLRLTFLLDNAPAPAAVHYSWPDPMPALLTASVAGSGGTGPLAVTGLGAASLPVRPVVVGVVPGAPDDGVVVDLDDAEKAAGGTTPDVSDQVWLSAGADAAMPEMLRAAGVDVTATETTGARAAAYLRQGPALAIALFLADAVAATVLASAGAIAALHLSGRRRAYELAALHAAGAPQRDLARATRLEQLLTLGFGVVVGVATGWAAALVALPSVPELVDAPTAPTLSFVPHAGPVLGPLAVGVVLLVLSAEVSGAALVRRLRADSLREGPS